MARAAVAAAKAGRLVYAAPAAGAVASACASLLGGAACPNPALPAGTAIGTLTGNKQCPALPPAPIVAQLGQDRGAESEPRMQIVSVPEVESNAPVVENPDLNNDIPLQAGWERFINVVPPIPLADVVIPKAQGLAPAGLPAQVEPYPKAGPGRWRQPRSPPGSQATNGP